MTPEQAHAYVVLALIAWGGLAVLFGIALGKMIAARDRREQPETTARSTPDAIELGTRLDVRL